MSILHVPTSNQYHTEDNLSPATVLPSPLDQFRKWFAQALASGLVREPEAVSLATASASGIPSCRIVLFKQLDDRGFVFFTNYSSRKSMEISDNPYATMVFYWREIHQSVRVLGKVEKIASQDSHEYFQSRPQGSKLGAWASRQSSIVKDGELEHRIDALKQRFHISEEGANGDIPTPDFWGGWRIVPTEIEFWLGKPSRLHDRVRYLLQPDGQWKIDRLAP